LVGARLARSKYGELSHGAPFYGQRSLLQAEGITQYSEGEGSAGRYAWIYGVFSRYASRGNSLI
jgi:hypothetical protein